ncbi:hypothetical protein BC629DRAFT_1438907 [Irpex lacteus]|nr:hypothetical protein BC629DRAFT_1438907 [Irpex lacteus]
MSLLRENSNVVDSAAPALPRFPDDIIHSIIQQLDCESEDEYKADLRSFALVARGQWRRSAQQLIHRVVEVNRPTYKRILPFYVSAAAGAEKQATPFDGQVWTFPRILLIDWHGPRGFLSWLQVPEFLAFLELCAKQLTRVHCELLPFAHPADAIQFISRFSSLRVLRIGSTQLTSSRTCECPVPFSLQQVSILHSNYHCTVAFGCLPNTILAWLRTAQESGICLSLEYAYHYIRPSASRLRCNVLELAAFNLRTLSLSPEGLTRSAEQGDYSKFHYVFPDLSPCTNIETLTFRLLALTVPNYAASALSSITSKALTSIVLEVDVEGIIIDEANPELPGLAGLAKLLSSKDQFPALRSVKAMFCIVYLFNGPPFQRGLFTALVEQEFGALVKNREEIAIQLEYDPPK